MQNNISHNKFGKNYQNPSCHLAKRGIKPYKRCNYCKLEFSRCLGMPIKLTAMLVSALLFLFIYLKDPLFIILNIVAILALLTYIAYQLNKSFDSLARYDFLNVALNKKLQEKTTSLEDKVRARTARLEDLLKKDWLTGMINRKEFEIRLRDALQDSFDNNSSHVLCFIDLDRFKIVNDTCGHRAGDELLRQITPIIKGHVSDTDVVARMGGDEFSILFSYTSIEKVLPALENIRQEVEDYRFAWNDTTFSIGSSIGVIGVTSDSGTLVDLLAAVDDACFRAKELGRNRIQVYEYDAEDLDKKHGETHWANRISNALDNNHFVLYFQPIKPLNELADENVNNEREYHFEVLIRMLNNNNIVIPPMAFIPAAERFDLMGKIDRWVIQHAMEAYIELQKTYSQLVLSVNLSGASLADASLYDYITGIFKQFDVKPENIVFEITETTAIANMQKASEFILRLKKEGCRFSLDDFGSGLSSFAYLKNLSVDYIKIDGSFVRDVASDKTAYTFVEAINRVGHLMNKKIIAEYVENKEVLFALKNIGVDFGQGYALGKPQSLDTLIQNVRKPYLKLVE